MGYLGVVGALDLRGDTDERATESVLGRGEQHLVLDLRVIGRPVNGNVSSCATC